MPFAYVGAGIFQAAEEAHQGIGNRLVYERRTAIAILVAMVVFGQYFSPDTVVRADGPFAGVQFAGS